MFSNTGFVGYGYRWFVGQVPPGKNQYSANPKWTDAWGDRVKIRIPGVHPCDPSLKDDDLPWAIVAKPTSHGNLNGGSTGIIGGEWVIGFFLDESNQIPVITHVLGKNARLGNSGTKNFQGQQQLGTTFCQDVTRYGNGIGAAGHQTVAGSKPNASAAKDITQDEVQSVQKQIANENSGLQIAPPGSYGEGTGTGYVNTYLSSPSGFGIQSTGPGGPLE